MQWHISFYNRAWQKVLIANQLGLLWTEIAAADSNNLATATAWLGVLAFTFEIYFDFSGYSDMAIGLGAMFGFSFPENFNYPYESKVLPNFGDGGIFHLVHGLGNMYIFHLAAIVKEPPIS